jgi:Uma2 family endonuclease
MARSPVGAGGPTIDDLESISDQLNRYELINGEIVVTPPPGEWHQDAAHVFEVRLDAPCEERGYRVRQNRGILFEDIEQAVIPDVVVYRPGRPPLRSVYLSPSDVLLVVEIVSRSTRRQDRLVKPELCASQGIPTYLLVDPFGDRPTVTLSVLADGAYQNVSTVETGQRLHLPAPLDFEIDTTGI